MDRGEYEVIDGLGEYEKRGEIHSQIKILKNVGFLEVIKT